jgi:hypothetical protein
MHAFFCGRACKRSLKISDVLRETYETEFMLRSGGNGSYGRYAHTTSRTKHVHSHGAGHSHKYLTKFSCWRWLLLLPCRRCRSRKRRRWTPWPSDFVRNDMIISWGYVIVFAEQEVETKPSRMTNACAWILSSPASEPWDARLPWHPGHG